MFKPVVIVSIAAMAALGAAGAVLALDRTLGRPDAVLPMAEDGHYWAMGGTQAGRVRFLVDTGATRVSLTRADAETLGVDLDDAAFTTVVRTPAGPVRAAPVRLEHLSVGPAHIEDVQALVFHDGLETSLLGMSFLGRLDRFGVSDGAMRLSG